LTKFYGNILSLSENIAKCFRGATFLIHTVGYVGGGIKPCLSNRSVLANMLKLSSLHLLSNNYRSNAYLLLLHLIACRYFCMDMKFGRWLQ